MPSSHTPSCFLLGLDLDAERAASESLGASAPGFFTLAQRVVWGVCQPDFVRVDVQAVLHRLETHYAECFATHLLIGFACRNGQPERAERALARAVDLCPADHPWRYLLPTPGEWRGELAPPRLREVVPDQVWRVHADFPLSGTPFSTASIATLVRAANGDLVFINPIALSDSLAQQVRDLGRVSVLAAQGRGHSRYIEPARALFPEAAVLGSAGHLEHPQAAHLRWDGLLGTPSGKLPDGFAALPLEGTTADEVVLLHEPTGTLIAQDLLAHNGRNNDSRSFGSRLYYFAFGLCDRIGMHSYQLLLWRDLPSLQRSLIRIADAPFERVTAAHWPFEPCEGRDVDALREQLRALARLTRGDRQRMLWRYMRHQPGFVVDLLRYKSRQRRLLARRPGPAAQAS